MVWMWEIDILSWNAECFCWCKVENVEYLKLFDMKYGNTNALKEFRQFISQWNSLFSVKL